MHETSFGVHSGCSDLSKQTLNFYFHSSCTVPCSLFSSRVEAPQRLSRPSLAKRVLCSSFSYTDLVFDTMSFVLSLGLSFLKGLGLLILGLITLTFLNILQQLVRPLKRVPSIRSLPSPQRSPLSLTYIDSTGSATRCFSASYGLTLRSLGRECCFVRNGSFEVSRELSQRGACPLLSPFLLLLALPLREIKAD